MRKYLIILLITLACVIAGCQTILHADIPNQQENDFTSTPKTSAQNYTANNISITIRNLDQIDHIKGIIHEEDETKLADALLNLGGKGLKTKNDLVRFLEVVNSLPTLDLIDGEMSTISYEKGLTQDTGKEYEFAYITIKADDGSWVRFEYLLSKENSATTDNNISSAEQDITVFIKPVQSADGRVKIFSEQSEDHPSGVGKLFTWDANIDKTNTRIVYYTKNQDKINTASTFSSVNILKIHEEKT